MASDANVCDRAWPSYSNQAVDFVIDKFGIGAGITVVDLGAGTGKFTSFLAKSGARIIALEPVSDLRRFLHTKVGDNNVMIMDGTAESMPIENASVDVIICAGSFDLFDASQALSECHRVLRDGGALVVIDHRKDDTIDWIFSMQHELKSWYKSLPSRLEIEQAVKNNGGFDHTKKATFTNNYDMNPSLLLDHIASDNKIVDMPTSDRQSLLNRIRHLTEIHPDLITTARM